MDNENRSNFNYTSVEVQNGSLSRAFMAGVFTWMFAALLLTAGIAYACSHSVAFLSACLTETGLSPIGYAVIFCPTIFSLVLGFTSDKLSYFAIIGLFLLFSIMMGMSLSFIFLIYQLGSIYMTFGMCAGLFGVMALLGYTTNTDLTKFGSIMVIGMFGIVAVSIVNFFLHSSGLGYLIGILGIGIFSGLTAYQLQSLKAMSMGADGSENSRKMAVWGAYSLYITFINLFLSLIRIFGSRR